MSNNEPTVIWLLPNPDGCFDGFHYAHGNAIRQARRLFSGPVYVIAGVHSDAEILRNKGPTLYTERNRYSVVASCRWVDQVVEDVPYSIGLHLIKKYHVDFVVHGDDYAPDALGHDCHSEAKSVGKYRECKRTDGISTTSLVQRILEPSPKPTNQPNLRLLLESFIASISPPPQVLDLSVPEPASHLSRGPCDILVYINGSWDCFGVNEVEKLRRAKNSYQPLHGKQVKLVVGIWSDEEVRSITGEEPLLSLFERALAVVQCKYSDALVLNTKRETSSAALGVNYVIETDNRSFALAALRAKVFGQRTAFEARQEGRSLH